MMQKGYSFLDKVRMDHGMNKCKAVFLEVYKNDRWKAISLLNDPRLTFPCLFIFSQMIEVLDIGSILSDRNIAALHFINRIQKKYNNHNGEGHISAANGAIYPIVKWILETGHADDGMDDEYEEIMDAAVSVLINVYKDNSILPAAADMIFRRNRKGHYIHDLLWAYFRSSDPETLKLIADRICSSDQQDIDLACHLLNLEEPNASLNIEDRQKQYQTYLKWLNENSPLLYFTGESYQYSSDPILYKIKKTGGEGIE